MPPGQKQIKLADPGNRPGQSQLFAIFFFFKIGSDLADSVWLLSKPVIWLGKQDGHVN